MIVINLLRRSNIHASRTIKISPKHKEMNDEILDNHRIIRYISSINFPFNLRAFLNIRSCGNYAMVLKVDKKINNRLYDVSINTLHRFT